jgi:hypothetical protein
VVGMWDALRVSYLVLPLLVLIRKSREIFLKGRGGDVREMLRRQHRCPRRILMPLYRTERDIILFQPGKRLCVVELVIVFDVPAFGRWVAHTTRVGFLGCGDGKFYKGCRCRAEGGFFRPGEPALWHGGEDEVVIG